MMRQGYDTRDALEAVYHRIGGILMMRQGYDTRAALIEILGKYEKECTSAFYRQIRTALVNLRKAYVDAMCDHELSKAERVKASTEADAMQLAINMVDSLYESI